MGGVHYANYISYIVLYSHCFFSWCRAVDPDTVIWVNAVDDPKSFDGAGRSTQSLISGNLWLTQSLIIGCCNGYRTLEPAKLWERSAESCAIPTIVPNKGLCAIFATPLPPLFATIASTGKTMGHPVSLAERLWVVCGQGKTLGQPLHESFKNCIWRLNYKTSNVESSIITSPAF